jgi:site-specific DNA-methyltransferase (adenine-specific)
VTPYDATIDLHDSYYAAVGELRRRRVADRLRLECGDCLEVIPRLVAEGVRVDAVVTDPPYHLRATLARFGRISIGDDTATSVRLRGRLDGAAWLGAGFMNQQWDGGDVAFRPETWATVATIMRPGAFLVAFGGTRTCHRLVCAIEDAGFVIQDQIAWLYGSGFPKHRSHLKPAHEPICLAYKPGGPRSLGVDECRVATDGRPGRSNERSASGLTGTGGAVTYGNFAVRGSIAVGDTQLGRWPANVVHDGSAEVLAGFPESESGPPRQASGSRERQSDFGLTDGNGGFGDSGSAARFFYSAKADAHDRWGSRHPTVKPIDLIRWLVTLVVPPGGIFLDPFAGSGTAAVAALASGRDAILIERDPGYVADIRERIAHYAGEGRHSLVSKGRARRESAAGSLL